MSAKFECHSEAQNFNAALENGVKLPNINFRCLASVKNAKFKLLGIWKC